MDEQVETEKRWAEMTDEHQGMGRVWGVWSRARVCFTYLQVLTTPRRFVRNRPKVL